MPDPHNLQRFLDAQSPVYPEVLRELRNQRKTSHWIWFIFPQIDGLGSSPTARAYALRSLAEATAYLAHPTLGSRLLECTQLLLPASKPIRQVLGSPDDLKFRSSMTLFAQVPHTHPIFAEALDAHFHSQPDNLTLDILQKSK